MGMVEKVARAMVAADSGPAGSALFEVHLREFGDGYRSAARAAIEAMREPTAVMAEAGLTVFSELDGACSSEFVLNEVHKAMIDAALKETNP